MWRWKYFEPEELLSPDGLYQFRYHGNLLLDPTFLDNLEGFREALGKPLLVNHGKLIYRGYRSPAEQERVNKSVKGYHPKGLAADITCPDMSVSDLYDFVTANCRKFSIHGIGYYPKKNFIHVDGRPLKANGSIAHWQG